MGGKLSVNTQHPEFAFVMQDQITRRDSLTLWPVNQQSLEGLVRANFDCPIGGLAEHGRGDPVKSSQVCHHLLTGRPSERRSLQPMCPNMKHLQVVVFFFTGFAARRLCEAP